MTDPTDRPHTPLTPPVEIPVKIPVEIRDALDAHTTLTLAYVDEDGPQACAVLYAVHATSGEFGEPVPSLLFVTSGTTRHGRALLAGDGRVAFTAQRDGQDWTSLTGIQGRGACRLLEGADREAAWHAYSARFPYVERTDRLRQAMERTGLWELRPDWLRLVDNGRGFGHKTEWEQTI
ncbi:pyridoxamine 5'-phosphate oxidase [Streptomyces hesseae]|uniref:Pyridoxamine 5'-phosphate oxidase n=1 Tax=Streptomyces hesseae TaxID=3075519 RepID=A0ABU2SW97_9ACTN|nr:pyridoxamine 5'-phosphate oxidase [Streptomyces sp. DSM 40473]MDT0453264.1 pyridoxamine 5'-phosphate oxidase [Streptomyces sp. DSM 40473]